MPATRARRPGGGGASRIFKQIITYILIIGICFAIYRIFRGDLGAIITWIWDWILKIVGGISDWFVNQPWFHNAFSRPK